jgi:hypothetical protein
MDRHPYHHRLHYRRALLRENDGCIGSNRGIATCCGVVSVSSDAAQVRCGGEARDGERRVELPDGVHATARARQRRRSACPIAGVARVVFALAACRYELPPHRGGRAADWSRSETRREKTLPKLLCSSSRLVYPAPLRRVAAWPPAESGTDQEWDRLWDRFTAKTRHSGAGSPVGPSRTSRITRVFGTRADFFSDSVSV